MKRFFALVLAFCLLVCLTACRNVPADPVSTTAATEGQSTKETGATQPVNSVPSIQDTEPAETTKPAEEAETSPTQAVTPTQPVTPTTPTTPATPTTPTQPVDPTQPSHQHSYTGKVTQAAGCTEKGTKTYTCSCGVYYIEGIPATGHSWGEWVTTKAPSTTQAGNSQRKCSNCQSVENKTIPKLPAPGPENGAVTQAQLDQIYDLFLTYVNAERTRVGVTPLSANSYLDSVAQIRSKETIQLFSHTRPDGQPWSSLIDSNSYPYTIIGENLCMTSHVGDGSYTYQDRWVGSQTQIEAAAGWLFTLLKNSPGHYANMIHEDFTECGIGISWELYDGTDIPMFYLAHIFGAR